VYDVGVFFFGGSRHGRLLWNAKCKRQNAKSRYGIGVVEDHAGIEVLFFSRGFTIITSSSMFDS
jgi:hypothetical protein